MPYPSPVLVYLGDGCHKHTISILQWARGEASAGECSVSTPVFGAPRATDGKLPTTRRWSRVEGRQGGGETGQRGLGELV